MGSVSLRMKPSNDTFSLLWLDTSVNKSKENIATQDDLRALINQLKIFEDCDECEQSIRSISKENCIILIVSGQLGRQIVPRVKAVVTNLKELTTRIQSDHTKRHESKAYESLPISIFDPNIIHQKLTTDLQGNFVHSQLLIDTLLRMRLNLNDKNEFISLCENKYKDNKKELKVIDDFKKHYSSDQALWWYTRDSFVSRMLNRTLRTQNMDVLFLFHFFISDIQQQLRCQSRIQVYRSQLMLVDELNILKNYIGKFISINSFFLTVLNRKKALLSLEDCTDLERVLFEINADPGLDGVKPFGNSHNEQDEILFMLGSIFQIVNISQRNDEVWIVQLELCTDTNQQFDLIRGNKNRFSFGHVLMTIGKIDEAEIYYQRLLNYLGENHPNCARCYQALGTVADERGDFNLSLKYFNRSLEMNSKTLEINDPNIALNYDSIGEIYRKTGDYIKAHESFNLALAIWNDDSSSKYRSKVVVCFNNIGIVYQEQQKYEEAHRYYEKAYHIRKRYFASDKISLGMSYNNIGNALYFLNRYSEALNSYEQALKSYGKSLPPKHIKVASTYNNIGAIYEGTDDIEKALSYYQKALKIYRHMFPETNSNVIKTEKNIRRISSKMKK